MTGGVAQLRNTKHLGAHGGNEQRIGGSAPWCFSPCVWKHVWRVRMKTLITLLAG